MEIVSDWAIVVYGESEKFFTDITMRTSYFFMTRWWCPSMHLYKHQYFRWNTGIQRRRKEEQVKVDNIYTTKANQIRNLFKGILKFYKFILSLKGIMK